MSKQPFSQRNQMFPVIDPKNLHLVFWNKQEEHPKLKRFSQKNEETYDCRVPSFQK